MAIARKAKNVKRKVAKAARTEGPGIELFLKKAPSKSLPKRGDTLPPLDIKANQKRESEIDKIEYNLEEVEASVYKAKLKSIGLSFDEMKRNLKKRESIVKEYKKNKQYFRDQRAEAPSIGSIDQSILDSVLCKQIVVDVCQQRVCVDQPVPLAVDDIWLEAGSNGSFNKLGTNTFEHEDEVWGYSTWNFTYHRHGRTHEGGINIRSSAELQEDSKIRQIGITFNPLLDYRGWPKANGVFGQGDDPFMLPPSWGQGKMWITFQVSTRIPGGSLVTHIPYSSTRSLYKDTGRIESRISQTYTYPPSRTLDLYQDYPAGTLVLIEARLEYWIKGNGEGGGASADYNLEVTPYMNLEACSWKYPNWVCVPVP